MTPSLLRAWQARYGLSVGEMAELLASHRRTVARWLAGKYPVRPAVVRLMGRITDQQIGEVKRATRERRQAAGRARWAALSPEQQAAKLQSLRHR